MPVSHIGLTVSHLPTSCSFFLSALQPLGYRFIGQQGNQIGLGIRDADFFLCQETPGVKAGAAHIAFTARSRTAVRDFYTAALTAGGRPNGAPASRTEGEDHFNAAILDLDGNSIEVVFRNGPDMRDDGTVIEHSRVITYSRSVTESIRDDRSVVSARSSHTTASRAPPAPASVAPSQAPSVASAASKAPTLARRTSEPVVVQQVVVQPAPSDSGAKTIIGTLLGAAAGAAVAYAMCKSERDSAKKEAEFEAFKQAKALQAVAVQAIAQPQLVQQVQQVQQVPQVQPPMHGPQPLPIQAQPICETAPRSVHRNINDAESQYSSPQPQSAYVQRAIEAAPEGGSVYLPRAIEAAPQSYYSPSHIGAPQTQVAAQRAIEYAPAYSVAPSRTQFSAHRSVTSPELLTMSKARSTVSRVHSVAPSAAPSTLISSFVPDRVDRRSSEGSVHSHHSSRSKAKSHVSKHSSTSRHTSRTHSRAPSPPPASNAPSNAPSKAPSKVASKAASIVGSILGRDSGSTVSKKEDDEFEIGDLDINDTDTVVPSDSISQVSSSRRSHRSHRSSSKAESTVSKHSSASKHSKHSKHSHHSSSRRSHHSSSTRQSSPEWWDVDEYPEPKKHSVVSEPSDASTVRPIKSKSARKDSVASASQYDAGLNGVSYGTGNVASIPIRGITPSMVEQKQAVNKSMITYAHGQKMRQFE